MPGSTARDSPSQVERRRRVSESSPYRRPAAPAVAPDTPSRLGGILSSLFSPFRSASKPVHLALDEEEDEDLQLDEDGGDEARSEWEHSEAEVEGAHSGPVDEGSAPPSPSPFSSSQFPSTSLTTPRAAPRTAARPPSPSPQQVLDALLEDRRLAGNPPLTPVQQDHIQRLMDAIRTGGENELPSAFTPNFRQSAKYNHSIPASPSLASIFGHSPAASTSTANGNGSTTTPAFRRRRPLYVGAGYSSQSARRRATKASSSNGEGFLKRSQSESSGLGQPAAAAVDEPEETVAEGKRRRVEEPVGGGAIKKSATEGNLAGMLGEPRKTVVVAPLVPKFAPVTTPARPSPLWQVSKADTPSPSPPKKQTTQAPPKAPTRAADFMMDIIRQEEASRPKVTREAVVNPYDSFDNPIARIPRSRPPRVAAPRKTVPAARAAAAAAASKVEPAKKEISPLEQIERSMPPEYRQDAKRARPSPASPAPPPAAAAAAKVLGHHGNGGHTGRDAVLGAGAGHIAENHHEKHGAAHAAHAHHTGGLAQGTPGTSTTTTTTTVPKASVGDKISGKVDVLVGKATHNPHKVAVGEVKQAEGKVGLEQRGLATGTGASVGRGGAGNMI
ncbi:hypothetical protein RQP46_010611 [Phenoliferia psychrophenolica]